MKISKNKVVKVLEDLVDYAYKETCFHEETYRGGVIWEICDNCGMKWADDEGGKPANVHDIPKEILKAEGLLNDIRLLFT